MLNTIAMNLKMVITIALALYTSRIVLDALGVIDFGIYSVVASVVAMFGFLNSSMVASLQRHLAYELGKKDFDAVRKIFNAGLIIHAGLAMTIFVIANSAGIWFIKHYLTIPDERLDVAIWVFHFVILSFMCNVISIPFQSLLNAKENMIVIAVVGVVESVLQLAVAIIISRSSVDRLWLYAPLLTCVFFTSLIIYGVVCYAGYRECRPMVVREGSLYRELTGFAGWNLFGTIAVMGRAQGLAILLNIFLGPAINAAYAIANRVNSQLSYFSISVTKAISPQIVKNYSAGSRDKFIRLIFQSSRFTFYMLYIISLPILLETDFVLDAWLKDVPEYAVIFCRLIIINSLLDSLSFGLIDAALATGRIRNYQMVVGSTVMLNLPLSYIALKYGSPPYMVIVISIVISLIATMLRLGLLYKMVDFPVVKYLKEVMLQLFMVVIITLTFSIPILLGVEGTGGFLWVLVVSLMINTITVYLVGLEPGERDYLRSVFKGYSLRSSA
ncbi:MAG: oligosaccharide flippase family protein [Thermodesulfovibrionia bacterium]